MICDTKALKAIDGSVEGYLGSFADITELISAQKRLKKLALYDSLTHLSNRYLFRNRLEKTLRQVKCNRSMLAVFFFDIDNFKKINDTLGHDHGDTLLCCVADVLKNCTRASDTVARMGGDEFTVLIPRVDRISELEALAHKLLEKLQIPIVLSGQKILISASIGIAIGDEHTKDANTLLKNADMAMYRAKALGRNNYQFFSEQMNQELKRHLDIERRLRLALENDELVLHYQPQVSVPGGEIIGFEGLLRWNCPDTGLVMPCDFISIAEETNLIIPIGELVIRQACIAVKKLVELGVLSKNGRIAVNISAKQFNTSYLVEFIKQCLNEYDVKPHQLELEITESLLMKDIGNSIEILLKLKNLGIASSIDDFGTGYSSLNYLKQLPIQILKVDQTFVRDIPKDQDDMEITSAIIAMAHKLGLAVIAEGVEHQAQVDFLKSNKCDYLQGFFFGKPMPLELITKTVHAAIING